MAFDATILYITIIIIANNPLSFPYIFSINLIWHNIVHFLFFLLTLIPFLSFFFFTVFDQSIELLSEFNLYKIPELYGFLHPLGKVRGIKAVSVDKFNRKILFGTAGGEIGEIDFVTGNWFTRKWIIFTKILISKIFFLLR